MTVLRRELRQYIALRRALGTRLQEPAATLERFLDFLEREKAQFITSELALRWAMQPQDVQQATWARRLGMVRGFASWLSSSAEISIEATNEPVPSSVASTGNTRGLSGTEGRMRRSKLE